MRVCDGNTWIHLIRERKGGKKETVGEFRWMWCGDGAGKKGN